MRSPSAAAPPFWVWLASVFAALALLGASVPSFLAAEAKSQPGHLRQNLFDAVERFGAEAPAAPRPLRIIAFGDSALGTATLQQDEMNAYARERGLDLDFLRLWVPFGVLDDVLPVLDSALAASPDVLMIEAWALVSPLDAQEAEIHRAYQAERPSLTRLQRIADAPTLIADHQAYLFDRFTGAPEEKQPQKHRAEREVAMAGARGAQRMRCDWSARRRMLAAVKKRNPIDGYERVDPLLVQTLDILLARAQQRGVRLVFFDIPRAQPLQELPAIVRKRALTLDLLHQYAGAGRLEFLEYSGQIPDDDTCDYVHFTPSGRERYMGWFVDRLRTLQKAPQP